MTRGVDSLKGKWVFDVEKNQTHGDKTPKGLIYICEQIVLPFFYWEYGNSYSPTSVDRLILENIALRSFKF